METTRGYSCPRLALWGALLTCAASISCHGGGGSEHSPALECSDSAVLANVVALQCGQRSGSDVQEIRVVIAGPTSSADIMGFDFDVVFDPTDMSYVPGSATEGTLLNKDGDDPLLLADLASNNPGRLIIGIHRTNQPSGVQGTSAENLILEFSVRANTLSPFGPSLLRFENAEAVDSSGSSIGSITFSDQLLLSVK